MARKTCRFPLFDGCPDEVGVWRLRSRELLIPAGALDARVEWVLPRLSSPPLEVDVLERAQAETDGRVWRVVTSSCWSIGSGQDVLPPDTGPVVCVELHVRGTMEITLAADLVYEVEDAV